MRDNRFLRLLDRKPVIVGDGAMGTMLAELGALTGRCPEEINLTSPAMVRRVHRGYVEAGADVIETNSFGGSVVKLAKTGLEDKVRAVNYAAARVAREAAGNQVAVAGSIGPLGELLDPLGPIAYDQAVAAFCEQAQGLIEGGVDVLLLETMYDLAEVNAALDGVCDLGLPVLCTLAFDMGGRTMMGVSPARFAAEIAGRGVTMIGANCGSGPDQYEDFVCQMRAACPAALIIVQPNAGVPELIDGTVVYKLGAEEMAPCAVRLSELGARYIGGCCGTTPAHIRAVAEALRRD